MVPLTFKLPITFKLFNVAWPETFNDELHVAALFNKVVPDTFIDELQVVALLILLFLTHLMMNYML